MIKYINALLILCAIGVIGLLVYNKFLKYSKSLPDFSYQNLRTNSVFNSKKFINDKNSLIVYVSTSCGSCEKTINRLNEITSQNLDFKYVLVCSEKDTNKAKHFFEKFNLNKSIILLNDSKNKFPKDFNLGFSIYYPTILSYHKGKLVKTYHDISEIK